MKNNTQRNIEVVFMKTSNKNLAPFTMYTIPLKTDISVLILVEVKYLILIDVFYCLLCSQNIVLPVQVYQN